jgi:predicted nucleotidyltransferase
MRDLVRAAAKVEKILQKKRGKFCFIGGLAVQKWGQVRVTQDIDLTVFTGIGNELPFIEQLLELFVPRIPDAREFAWRNRVVLLRTKSGVELDVSCGAFSFEESVIARARRVEVRPGVRLRLCTAEDLIVYKAFAGRPLDWADVESIIARQPRGKLDWRYIYAQLKPLAELKEEPDIVPKLKNLRRIVEID